MGCVTVRIRFARGMLRRLLSLLFLFIGAVLDAQTEPIPAVELQRDPSPERIATLMARADQYGWGANVLPLRQAALAVYEHDPATAAPWYYLYRWARMLSVPQTRAVQDWVQAVNEAKVGHKNMSVPKLPLPGSLAGLLSPEFQRYALGSPAFSEEFFSELSPLDQPVHVLTILQTLYAANPATFVEYANLALAIALVYDVPPPPAWPHGQVSEKLLPRQFPPPLEAFNHWVRLDRLNLTAHRLRRLPASELKFVVDTVTPLAELSWIQRNVSPPLAQLAEAYAMVKYRQDRLKANAVDWSGPDYRLESILRDGGICVDQAYFAANAGKARGIPTLLFRGAGLDGRHAWFGFLSPNGWVLDAGRYAEQRYVVGLAYDPQTWRNLNDYELLFLSERFRQLPLYRLSVIQANFALEYQQSGDHAAALKSAREAVNRERRNLGAWQVLLEVTQAGRVPAREVEGVLREAALALGRYPDLEVAFTRQLIESLRARGETSLAAAEEQKLARKYQGNRSDLTVQTAVDILQRSLKDDELPARIQTFNRLLQVYGQGASVDFFDRVVVAFVMHLRDQGQFPSAYQSLERARQTLRVDKGSQLEKDFDKLKELLDKGS
jgi:hypothetical protein